MAELSKLTVVVLVAGGIVVGVATGRWWERSRHADLLIAKEEIEVSPRSNPTVDREMPRSQPSVAATETALRELALVFQGGSEAEYEQTLRKLMELPAGPLDACFVSVMEQHPSVDPDLDVVLLLRANLGDPESLSRLGDALGRLARSDSALAVERFRQVPKERRAQFPHLASEMVEILARSDFALALRFVGTDLSTIERGIAFQFVIRAAGTQPDPITAAQQVVALAPPEQRTMLWDTWARGIAETDLGSVQSLFERLPPEASPKFLVGALADQLARADLTKAGKWASNLPAGDARIEAYRVLTGRLATESPKTAEQWLQTMPDIPERTAAISEFVRKTTYKDTEAAVRWALTLPDIETNPEPFERAAKYWLQQQRDKATEYFQTHEVPEALRSIVQPKAK